MGQFWQIFKTVKMHNTGETTPEKKIENKKKKEGIFQE